ncbi:hypothetical protein Barba10S_gp034 [Rheinheimera phage vB_RspM_Barba10S]|jgi:hypothetical protein|uniref:Uncharacterized protein n=3 Tax=Barbavirus TaxID=2733095 RepID=A0A4P8NCB6_9CAUD|nr:hypothetical protein Barba3A_gp034 [Rheinheimera phage vB_RspM_Barba3A]QCQ60080.1 hypothetical protein Barba10S_gp034 [Rheinheimera phage vB_RspM_Barba10S]QCQ64630.1 hypothetical protein Barba31A_gp040 [Rheinheimera phage vB_RspM_Barba31A]
MKHTKEQLRGMSDAQVNKELELLLNPKAEFIGQHYVDTGDGIYSNVIKYPEGSYYRECPAYCRDVSDIMPLAFEHGISAIHLRDGYLAVKYENYLDVSAFDEIDGICADGEQFGDKNPLRAIACCLILVLQEKQIANN